MTVENLIFRKHVLKPVRDPFRRYCCQEIMPFGKLPPVINFSLNQVFSEENLNFTADLFQEDLQKDYFAWLLSRMTTADEKKEIKNIKQIIPTWSAFNSAVNEDN